MFARKKEGITQNRDRYEFDVLIASQTIDGDSSRAHLSYIDDNGIMNEIFDPYIIIGSDSAKFYGSIFIKPFYKKILRMNESAELAYFTLNGQIDKASNTLLGEWESETNKMLDNFEQQGIHKLL